MNIYFGKVPTEEVLSNGSDGLYKHDGEYYYYCIDFSGEYDVVIKDSCGRSVPMEYAAIPPLVRALNLVWDDVMNIIEGNDARQALDNTSDTAC
jgi:hypothetical protein